MKRTLTATVKNIGSVSHTFFIGATVGAPGAGTGCGLNVGTPYNDLTPQQITLNPGDATTLTWGFDDSGLNEGTNWAVVKAWESCNNICTTCYAGNYCTFDVLAAVAASIINITVNRE